MMQPDEARALHGVVEVAVDRFPEVAPELVERVALRVEAERAGQKPPASLSSLTSKMTSVPDIARSVRLRLCCVDSTAIGAGPNLLHAAVRVEPIPDWPARPTPLPVLGHADCGRRSAGANEPVDRVDDVRDGVAQLLHGPVDGVALGHVCGRE